MMNQPELDARIARISRKSRFSALLLVIFVAFIAFSFYYYNTSIQRLASKVQHLNHEITQKNTELNTLQSRIEKQQSTLKNIYQATEYLQDGMSSSINRQYPDAIASYHQYLKRMPDSPEGLNFLGYAELRHSQQWLDNAKAKGQTHAQRQESLEKSRHFHDLAKEHLNRATRLHPQKPWPRYNLAVAHLLDSELPESMAELETLLSQSPEMLKWLCNDGQFRKLRLDAQTAESFVKTIKEAMQKTSIAECWVIRPPTQ